MTVDYAALALVFGCLFAAHGFGVRVYRNGELPPYTAGDSALFILPLLFAAVFYLLVAFDIADATVYVPLSRATLTLFIISALYLNRCVYARTYRRVVSWLKRLTL